jgi:hypothetical protein
MVRSFLRVTHPIYQWLGLRLLRIFFRVTHPSSEFVIDPASFVRGQAAMKPRALCFRRFRS